MMKTDLRMKGIALALVIALAISLLPIQVFAEEVAEIPLGEEVAEIPLGEEVAEIPLGEEVSTPVAASQPEGDTGEEHSARMMAETATGTDGCSVASPHAETEFNSFSDGDVHYVTNNEKSLTFYSTDASWTKDDPNGLINERTNSKTTYKFRVDRETTGEGTVKLTCTEANGTVKTVTIIVGNPNTHTHTWAESVDAYPGATQAEDFTANGWLIVTAATCTEAGQKVRKCTAADCTLTTNPETQEIPQLSHVDENSDALCDNGCGAVVTTVLEQAIAAAEAAKSGVTEAENGSAISSTASWAPAAAFTALNGAIKTAQDALTAATAAEVLAAKQAMETATDNFTKAVQPGEKAPACDCGPLNPHKTYTENSQVISIDIGEQGAEHWIELKGLEKDGTLADTGRFLVKGYGTENKNEKNAFLFDPTGVINNQDKQETTSQRFITVAKGNTTATVTVNAEGTTGTQDVSIQFHVVDTTGEEVTVTFQDADGATLDTTTAANRIGKTLTEAAITVPTVTPDEGLAFKGWYVVDGGSLTATAWDPETDTLKTKTLTLRAVMGKQYRVNYFLMEDGVETAKPVPGLSSATGVADRDAASVSVEAPAVMGYVVVGGQTTQSVDMTKPEPAVTFYYQKAYEMGTQHLVPTNTQGTTFAPFTIAAAPDATLELVSNNDALGLTAAINNTMGVAVAAGGKSLTVDATKVSADTAASTIYVKATTPAAEPGGEARVTYYYLRVEPPKEVTVTYQIDDGKKSTDPNPGKADKFDKTKLTIPTGGVLSEDGTTITFSTYAGAPLPVLSGDYPTHETKQFAGWNMTAGTLTTGSETYTHTDKTVNIPKAPYEAGELKLGNTDVTLVTGWRNYKSYLKILAVDTLGNDMHIQDLLNLTRQRETEDYGFSTSKVSVNGFDAIQIEFLYDNNASVDVDLAFKTQAYTLLGFYYHKRGTKDSAIQRNPDVKGAGSWQLVNVPSSITSEKQTAADAPVVNLVLAKAYTVKYHLPEEAGVTMKDNVDEQTFVKEHLPDDPNGRTKVVNDLVTYADHVELLEVPKSLHPDHSIVGWYAEDGTHYATNGFIDLEGDLSALDKDGDRVINLSANYVRAGKKYTIHYDANLPSNLPQGTTAGNMSKDAQGESDEGSFQFTVGNAKPTLVGYVFKGWSQDNASPAADATLIQPGAKLTLTDDGLSEVKGTLYAIWEPSYTVTYTDGVDGEEIFADQTYSVLEGGNTPAFKAGNLSGNPQRNGYTFNGWSPAWAGTVSDNVTYKATWVLRQDLSYTVNYLEAVEGQADKVLKDPSTVGDQTYGREVTVTPDAITGYTAPAAQKITIGVTGNVVNFYYTAIPYTVEYDPNGGTTTSTQLKFENLHYGDHTPTINDPTREAAGHTYYFSRWDPVFSDTVTGNVKYTAVWADNVSEYTVTYDLDGDITTTGDQVKFQGKHYGDPTPTVENPTKAEDDTYTYEFASWSPVFSDTVKGDTVYVAQWTPTYKNYTVEYDPNGGTTTSTQLKFENLHYGDLTPTINDPTREAAGHTYYFSRWDPVFSDTVTGNVKYTAVWADNVSEYTVTYDLDGDVTTTGDQVKFPGKHYGDPTPTVENPTKAEDDTYTYTFAGWSPAFSDTVKGGVTYVAQWTNTYKNYTVEYDPNGGTTTSTQLKFENLHYGDLTPTINDPTRAATGHTYYFSRWDPVFSDTVTGNVKYTAVWADNVSEYTVTYDLDGDVTTTGDQVKFPGKHYGDPTPTVENPTKAEDDTYTYTFAGWSPAFSPTVKGGVTYVAQWTATYKSHSVSYDLAGGRLPEGVSNPTSYTAEDPDFKLNNPVRDGYVFDGWTGNHLPEKTDEVTVDTAKVQDLVFTANWLVDANKDGVADKYQVKLIYKAGANGSVTGKTEKVITLTDSEGNYVERLEEQIPGTEGVNVTANSGYSANGWDTDPTAKMTYVGGQSYEFTAQFKSVSSGGGPRPRPRPSNPPEEELEDPDVPLADLPQLNTKDHVAYLIGRTDGTIAPMDNITRGEVATIFFRLLTEESRAANWATSCSYWDMDGTEYYYNPVSTATKAGLIQGYADGSFGGSNQITRAEMATIAARFLSDPYSGANLFTDIDGHWAAEYINRAAKVGWFKVTDDNGNSVGNFRPDDYITRAEVVVMINRMLGRKADRDHLLPDMKTWPDNVDTPATAWYYLDIQEATNSHDYTQDTTKLCEAWVKMIANPDWAAMERR